MLLAIEEAPDDTPMNPRVEAGSLPTTGQHSRRVRNGTSAGAPHAARQSGPNPEVLERCKGCIRVCVEGAIRSTLAGFPPSLRHRSANAVLGLNSAGRSAFVCRHHDFSATDLARCRTLESIWSSRFPSDPSISIRSWAWERSASCATSTVSGLPHSGFPQ